MATSPSWTWPDAEVVKVIDGDTLEMKVTRDLGFGGSASFSVRLRLNRINAPKVTTASGKLAHTFLETLLPVGAKFELDTFNPYKFGGPDTSPGEWMAEIPFKVGSAATVSDLMVATGHAVYWNGEGPRPEDG